MSPVGLEIRGSPVRGELFCFTIAADSLATLVHGDTEMAKKTTKRREWTKEDVHTLKTLARERVKTSVIARRLKRTEGATRQQAFKLGVSFKAGRGKKRK
jgi:hypothetical protein